MQEAIRVEGITKQYQLGALRHETMLREVLVNMFRRGPRAPRETILALNDLSFHVDEGEVVGLIGRNGAGKSTLLKVLSKITYPTSGRIRVRGRVASLIEVGTGFHDELTGRENIYLNGSILGMRKREIDARLDQIIAFAGVDQFVDTPIKRYSSGMRLRLGFAVAAHMEPDVLFVDEVLAVGDAEFQKKCLSAMDDMRTGGRTVIFVSHNMAAIENLCPRTIWIDAGKMRMDGPSDKVIAAYLATFSESQRAGYDLANVEGRGGNGAARFTRVDFMDMDGNPAALFRCGEPLRARFHYKAKERIRDPKFGMVVYSDMGTKVFTASTWHAGYFIPVLDVGEGYIDLLIDDLFLQPNRYYLSLWIRSTGVFFDHLEHCLAIDVEASNVGNNQGKGVHAKWGLTYMASRWDLSTGGATSDASMPQDAGL
ncbi:MAG: ABC transporter ATP-binding protein [Candidatus Krumholzibacteria bacterium]|nr:ABC transporter ATP-binding protein [Candidatus Krumholzibacteria bacterium]MDH4338411.1 ABC transporter ATP-binding protein [Candidatus Krumholzibacteria bacterium]MDH5269081.1 ABC transporter ATP-binding protein [Candidatus Krumholzibacteria bacterium]